jgi:hypothetical protein
LSGFSWLSGKDQGARSRLINSLAQDGFKPGWDPGSQKLNTVIQQVQTNQANAAQLLGSQDFLNVDQAVAVTKYIGNALGSGLLGKWSGAEMNAGGVGISVAVGLTGFDLPKDIADLSYDIANWKWSWSHAGETALDLVGTLPLIGAVKNIRNASKLATTAKAAANIGEAAADTAQGVKQAANVLGDVKQAANGASDLLPILQLSCFVAGTPVLTPRGAKAIEALQPGDVVLSRPEC